MKNDSTALTYNEIVQQLGQLSKGWQLSNSRELITKDFKFKNFLDSLDFINRLAPYCEKMNHHPNIYITYDQIRFELQTFDVGGKITYKDFLLAKKIEEIYNT